MEIYDVSLSISQTLPIYPGDPGIEILQASAIANGDAANVTLLHLGSHTGTHIDAPAHFIEGARKVDSLSLETLMGEAYVVEIPSGVREITTNEINDLVPRGAKRILLRTRNSKFWNDIAGSFRTDYSYLSPAAARTLVDRGVRLVGIDYLSIEAFDSKDFETHKVLLENGVIIVEGLDLRVVAPNKYELICLPLKIADGTGDGAPARVILREMDLK